jgi:hypothetical protein
MYPNASPMQKFYAMQSVSKLMTGQSQQQFSNLMSVLRFKQGQEQFRIQEEHRLENERRNSPEAFTAKNQYSDAEKGLVQVNNQLEQAKNFQQQIKEEGARLSALANKTFEGTGIKLIDEYVRTTKSKYFSDADYQNFSSQLNRFNALMMRANIPVGGGGAGRTMLTGFGSAYGRGVGREPFAPKTTTKKEIEGLMRLANEDMAGTTKILQDSAKRLTAARDRAQENYERIGHGQMPLPAASEEGPPVAAGGDDLGGWH